MTLIIEKPAGAKLVFAKDPVPFDNDAWTYIAAVEAADGQILEQATRNAITNFVLGCKADGIWTAIKASCILAGARTLAGALVPLVGTAPTNVDGLFVSGDYNRKTGLGAASNTTKYLNSNRNNNADPQNNRHLALYLNVSAYSGQNFAGGRGPGGVFTGGTSLSHTATNARFRSLPSTDTQQDFGAATLNTAVLMGLSRNASNSYTARVSGSSSSITSPSTTPVSANFFLFALNNNGAPTAFSSDRFAFYSIGESLNLALLDARVTDLINAFAAAIP
jgi:hypothetical protein